ncbi:MAG: GAF domain-containing protein, partial [Chloroflexota bacterium]
AVAVENQRLFAETQSALTELREVQQRYTVNAWQNYNTKIAQPGFELDDDTITPVENPYLPPDAHQAVIQKTPVLRNIEEQNASRKMQTTQTAMAIPLMVRDEVIGVVSLEDPIDNQSWTADELAFVEAIVEQMAQTAENLRLLDETRQQADYERTVGEITQKIREAPSMEKLLEVATSELRQHLSASHAKLDLKINRDSQSNGTAPSAKIGNHTIRGES